MTYYLLAHCPTDGCYMRVPVCNLTSNIEPEFDPTLTIGVVCHGCGKEFREAASQLEIVPQANVTAKFQSIRR